MGASKSRDIDTSITSEGGERVRIKYAVAYVQGSPVITEDDHAAPPDAGRTMEDGDHTMEDAHAIVPDLDDTTSFFGVYDGHGGHEVALLCAKLFHIELKHHPNYQNDLVIAIRSVFSRMDEVLQQSNEWREFVDPTAKSNFLQRVICPIANPWYRKRETPYMPPQNTGSSASVVVIRGNWIIVGNVGDSHCVASRNHQAIQLSTDHKPRHPYERVRIENAGGNIDIDQQVVKEAGQRGMFATSRAIGDFEFKQNKTLPPEEQIVICNPDIHDMEITNDVEFLVIASQGIWESMTCQGVVDYVHEELEHVTNPRVICERLVRFAQAVTDLDLTAILIQFKHEVPAPVPAPAPAAEESEEASDGQEIKPAASNEQQQPPFAPNG
ncbi:unnamed protein product [Urochloa decumbens]|uniref:protein-serine/threonine phosphatase n=1 Tax=Urochloa decumbens TaxID=240449 RepID=A0ABC9EII6_9POAL